MPPIKQNHSFAHIARFYEARCEQLYFTPDQIDWLKSDDSFTFNFWASEDNRRYLNHPKCAK